MYGGCSNYTPIHTNLIFLIEKKTKRTNEVRKKNGGDWPANYWKSCSNVLGIYVINDDNNNNIVYGANITHPPPANFSQNCSHSKIVHPSPKKEHSPSHPPPPHLLLPQTQQLFCIPRKNCAICTTHSLFFQPPVFNITTPTSSQKNTLPDHTNRPLCLFLFFFFFFWGSNLTPPPPSSLTTRTLLR